MSKNFLEIFLKTGTILLVLALIAVVFLQVFARYFLPSSPSWTEEASRFIFIYAVAFAAPLAVLDNAYVKVDFLIEKFSINVHRKLTLIFDILILIFFILIFIGSLSFTYLGFTENSPAMKIKMVIPFFSITFLTFFMCVFYIKIIFKSFFNRKNREEL